MKKYMIVSNEYHAGKTSIILGLGLLLLEQKKKIGYFKPWSILSEKNDDGDLIDPNLILLQKLLKLTGTIDDLYGVKIPPNYLTEFFQTGENSLWKNITSAIDKAVNNTFDYFFTEGHGYPYFGEFINIPHERIRSYLEAKPIIVAGMNRYDKDRILDGILGTKHIFSSNKGALCLINKLPPDFPEQTLKIIENELQKHGIEFLGAMPESKILANPTVKDIFQRVQGQIINPPTDKQQNRLIQEFLIGAMDVQGALPYLRENPSKAVITGGDRSDLILAAMETNTELLILTGTKYPESKVLLRARREEIPILMVPYDTHTVAQQLDRISWLTPPDNQMKIDEAKSLIKKHVQLELLDK